MAPSIDVNELILRPLDVIARLRVDLKAQGGDANDGSAVLARAISDVLCSGASPALERVPVLSRESVAKVRMFILPESRIDQWSDTSFR